MSERPSCPETDCGLNIGVWSMRSLLDSETRGKREGEGRRPENSNGLPVQSS
jgi:hypothetical protein